MWLLFLPNAKVWLLIRVHKKKNNFEKNKSSTLSILRVKSELRISTELMTHKFEYLRESQAIKILLETSARAEINLLASVKQEKHILPQ